MDLAISLVVGIGGGLILVFIAAYLGMKRGQNYPN